MTTGEDLKDEIRRAIDDSLKTFSSAKIHVDRRYPRSRVVWRADLIGHQHTVRCTVQDMSVNGAKLELDEPFIENNDLWLSVERFGKLECEVIWRNDDELGVRFKKNPADVYKLIGSVLPRTGAFKG